MSLLTAKYFCVQTRTTSSQSVQTTDSTTNKDIKFEKSLKPAEYANFLRSFASVYHGIRLGLGQLLPECQDGHRGKKAERGLSHHP